MSVLALHPRPAHLRRHRRSAAPAPAPESIVPLHPAPDAPPAPRQRILIGGMPRGGTTMTMKLVGADSRIFSWPGETSVLALTREIWAGGKPNPACREQLTRFVRERLTNVLVDMQAFNAEQAQINLPTVADATLEKVVGQVVDGLIGASSMRAALRNSSTAIEHFVASQTDSPIIAEKTPTNIFAYGHLAAESSTSWIVCHREPFATIASIRARVGADPYSGSWDKSIESCIGVYLRSAEHVLRAMRGPNKPLVAQYEEVNADPAAFIASLAEKLGIDPEAKPKTNFVWQKSDREAWRKFTPLERWKVLHMTAPARHLLGYDEAYYGCGEADMLHGFEPPPPQFEAAPLYGMHVADGGTSGRWVSDEAAFAIFAPHAVRYASASFVNPSSMDLGGQRLVARDGAKRKVAEIALPLEKMGKLVIDLDAMTPAAVTDTGRLYRVELDPLLKRVPIATQRGNLDCRIVSCFATPWTPHTPS